MTANAINAMATTAPMTGPTIHAFEAGPCDELLLWSESLLDAVADGPDIDAVFRALDLVPVGFESIVVVVVGVWKSVDCHRTNTALALSPPEVVRLVTLPPWLYVQT
jgi:hypothetical protein